MGFQRDFNGILMGLKHGIETWDFNGIETWDFNGISTGLKHEWLHFLLKCSAMNF